ncbi:MAG: caspase family protein [Woeseiaceae bacterium]|nr:caspase family protein [Woeseiaceae bacterium]
MMSRSLPAFTFVTLVFSSLAILGVSIAPDNAIAADRNNRYALIVGVSEYPSLEGKDLYGPANDARLVADTLTNWGFERGDIRIVADGVEGAELPTRAAILDAMEDLIDDVRDGDFVYLHFSGHGSRQPVVVRGDGASEEPDNFDEIFLPRDIGYWDDGTDAVENAIVDDEINYFITNLRNNGAFVWIVFDSCHSGDMTRSIEPDGELDREIDFLELVRPAERDDALAVLEEAESSQVRSRGAREAEHSFSGDDAALDDDAAGYVAFFAAQTTETTPEMRLPKGVRPRQAHGMFTFTLMNLVQTQPGLTYRQLGDQVMRAYESMHRTRPTPLFVGTSLDAAVFGADEGERVEQYRVDVGGGEITVPAGSLLNVTNGTILAVVPHPGAETVDAIGYLEITASQLSDSRAVPVEYNGVEALDADSIPGTAYARPVQRPIALAMTVALPEDEAAARSIRAAVASDEDGLENMIEWVEARDPADLRLLVQDDAVWLLPPSGQLCSRDILSGGEDSACAIEADLTPSVAFPARGDAQELTDSLRAVARATNLMNVARATSTGGPVEVALVMEVRHEDSAEFEGVPEGTRPVLRPGDYVRFRIENRSNRAQDVTVLFIDSRWGIESYYPMGSGGLNRIEAGGSQYIGNAVGGFPVTVETTGMERMLMIAVPARGGDPVNFSGLEQPTLAATRDLGAESEFGNLLEQAGFRGGQTRGLGQQTQEDTTTQVLTWITAAQ